MQCEFLHNLTTKQYPFHYSEKLFRTTRKFLVGALSTAVLNPNMSIVHWKSFWWIKEPTLVPTLCFSLSICILWFFYFVFWWTVEFQLCVLIFSFCISFLFTFPRCRTVELRGNQNSIILPHFIFCQWTFLFSIICQKNEANLHIPVYKKKKTVNSPKSLCLLKLRQTPNLK